MCEKQYDVIGIANPILDLILEMDQLPSTNTNGKMRDVYKRQDPSCTVRPALA